MDNLARLPSQNSNVNPLTDSQSTGSFVENFQEANSRKYTPKRHFPISPKKKEKKAENDDSKEIDTTVRRRSLPKPKWRSLKVLKYKGLGKYKLGWRRVVRMQEFTRKVQDGDILLFSLRTFTAACVRCALWSPIDHVAVVVSHPQFGYKILESIATGVRSIPLDLLAYGKFAMHFHRLYWRRLEYKGFSDTEEQWHRQHVKAKLREFSRENLGVPYERNVISLINPVLGIKQDSDQSSFFCTELVAAALKFAGIIDDKRSSNDYLPGDFTSKMKIPVACCRARSKFGYGKHIYHGRDIRVILPHEKERTVRESEASERDVDAVLDEYYGKSEQLLREMIAIAKLRHWFSKVVKDWRQRREATSSDGKDSKVKSMDKKEDITELADVEIAIS